MILFLKLILCVCVESFISLFKGVYMIVYNLIEFDKVVFESWEEETQLIVLRSEKKEASIVKFRSHGLWIFDIFDATLIADFAVL